MKNKNKGITVVNLLILIVVGSISIFGGYMGITTMISNNKKDNFVNTSKEYVEGAKQQLMSEDFMPSNDHAVIVPYTEIRLTNTYNSPYTKEAFSEDYSYVIILKQNDVYKYYVTQIDSKGNCMDLIDYDKINNYSNKNRQYVVNDNSCKIESVLLVGPDFKFNNDLFSDNIKFTKYQNR